MNTIKFNPNAQSKAMNKMRKEFLDIAMQDALKGHDGIKYREIATQRQQIQKDELKYGFITR